MGRYRFRAHHRRNPWPGWLRYRRKGRGISRRPLTLKKAEFKEKNLRVSIQASGASPLAQW